ncbi:MAG TPA: AAA family ATPase [Candidatus Dormibacteraeota bacterium]
MNLVGRESDLATVSGLLSRAAAGPSGLVVSGPAGIGKSEIWRAAVRLAETDGFCVLAARPVEVEAGFSFAALGDLLADALDPVLPSLAEPQRRALEVALLRTDDTRPLEPRAVGMALLNVLLSLASASPILVAVDDAQWLDAPSQGALEYAVRRLKSERVAVIATVRDQLVIGDIPVIRAMPPEAVDGLRLEPLSLGALQRVLHERSRAGLHRYTVLRIHEASGGNPMLALEIAAALEAEGATPRPGRPLPVPVGMTEVLERRVSSVGSQTAELLAVAASLAQPTIELLSRASRTNPVGALTEASRAGLIAIRDNRVEFTHPLLRYVIAKSLPAARRRRLHVRLAAAVDNPEEKARHLALSVDEPDERVAAELELAAKHATARGAVIAAAELLEMSAALTPPAGAVDSSRRRLAAADAYFFASDGRRSTAVLKQLLDTPMPAHLRSQALCRLGLVRCFTDSVPASVPLLEEAVTLAGDDASLRVSALLPLSLAKAALLRVDEAKAHVEDALARAQAGGDATGMTEAMAQVAYWRFIASDEPYAPMFSEATARAATDPAVRLTFGPDFWSGRLLKCTDDLDGARAAVTKVHAMADERGDEQSLISISNLLAEIELAAGDWQAALRRANQSIEVSVSGGWESYGALSYALRALIQAHLGLVEAAHQSVEAGRQVVEKTGFYAATLYLRWTVGFLALSRGDAAGADAELGDLAAMSVAYGVLEPGEALWLMDEAEAMVALGRDAEAISITDAFLEASRRRGRRWCEAAGLRTRALARGARGELAAALADAGRAVEISSSVSRPFETARCLLVKGILERRSKNRTASRQTLSRAIEMFTRLGARLWWERAEEELGRAGAKQHAADELSVTEQRVAELAASGRTNPEIAAGLFMSRKTVEANLAKAYRKLGIQTRMQLKDALGGRTRD